MLTLEELGATGNKVCTASISHPFGKQMQMLPGQIVSVGSCLFSA